MTDLEALNLLIAGDPKISSERLDYLLQTLGRNKLFVNDEYNHIIQALRYLRDNSGGGGGGIQSIQEGENITIDNTDPLNPIISANSSGGQINPQD